MSYEFMNMISRNVESRLEDEQIHQMNEERLKVRRMQKLGLTIFTAVLIMITFFLHTPH